MTDRPTDSRSPGAAASQSALDDEARAERRRERRERLRQQRASSRVLSPCVAICQIDEAGRACIGCHRTLDEIRDWMIMDDGEKQAVLDRIAAERGGPSGR